MGRAALCWMLVAAGGCDSPVQAAAGISTLPAAVESAGVAEPADSAAPEADKESAGDVEGPSAGPLRVVPSIRRHAEARHASKWGWAADGKSFALCIDGPNSARQCTFTSVDGKAFTLEGAAATARLKADGVEQGPDVSGRPSGPKPYWRHGKDIELDWQATDGRARLALGATRASGESVSDLVWMDFDPDFGADVEIFVEVVSVAPRGDRIAVVGHAQDGAEHEFKTILLYSDDIAARAHAQVGHDYLEKEKFEKAVAAFEEAVAAHPDGWEFRYDLACGRARSGVGDVRRPLERAIDLGGVKVRSKAQRDSALASVKRTAWFKALVAID